MRNDAKRKYIRAVRDDNPHLISPEYLGRNIPRRPTFLIQQIFLPNPACQSEISYHVIFAFVFVYPHHYVLEFEVAVHDSLLAEMLQTHCDVFYCF